VRYNTLLNLIKIDANNPKLLESKTEMLKHPKIKQLIEECKTFSSTPLKRHNDARHSIHKIAILADFGIKQDDPGIEEIVKRVLSHQSGEGSFQSLLEIPVRYEGKGKPEMGWMLCDAPTLLYSLQKFQVNNQRVNDAIDHLLSLVDDNGWQCRTSSQFRGLGGKQTTVHTLT
jgi:hypothetical protein